MKDFDSYLRRTARTEPIDWSPNYIGYSALKTKISEYAKRRKVIRKQLNGSDVEFSTELMSGAAPPAGDYYISVETEPEDIFPKLARDEKQEFIALLEKELTRCATFYHFQLGTLRMMLPKVSAKEIDLTEAASEFLEVFHFCVCNIIALRQILLRYNAFCRTFDTGSALLEIELHRRAPGSSLSLFQLEPLAELHSTLEMRLMVEKRSPEATAFSEQYNQFRSLLDKSLTSMERASGGHVVFRDQFISALRSYFLVGSVRFGLSLEPNFLVMKGRHLKKEIRKLSKWRETRVLEGTDVVKYKLDPANAWPLVLNLISCFLFMMNNYIIEPSSAYYANALGSSDALSGIMIGAAPWFALLSAVAYSFWTNYSYKHPILFAGVLMMMGNLLYASAYSYNSMTLCLVGRAISGLGAPRVINRRYVADATPFALRTAASAAFALMTALGAALGPGMAIVLDSIKKFEFSLPFLGKQYFNGMTGPGYFMALMWFIYSIMILLTFGEPKRSGLDELRDREGGSAGSELMSQKSDMEEEDDDDDASVDSTEYTKNDDQEVSLNSPLYCIKHMTRAAALCMAVIFMKRIALEAIVGSTSIVTKNRYAWSIQNVGTLHLINGVIVIPVSILAGYLSQFFEDRFLALWLLMITIFGMMFMVDVTDLVDHSTFEDYNEDANWSVGPIRYIAGSLIAFSGIEACESFVASLMSKVVPSKLAVGTFNSGLLATLVGTSGRAVGDLFITCMGLLSIRNLLNLLIIPGITLMLISMIFIRRNYDILAV